MKTKTETASWFCLIASQNFDRFSQLFMTNSCSISGQNQFNHPIRAPGRPPRSAACRRSTRDFLRFRKNLHAGDDRLGDSWTGGERRGKWSSQNGRLFVGTGWSTLINLLGTLFSDTPLFQIQWITQNCVFLARMPCKQKRHTQLDCEVFGCFWC